MRIAMPMRSHRGGETVKLVQPYARIVGQRSTDAVFTREDGIDLLRRVEYFARISHRSEDAQTHESWERFLTSVVLKHGDWSVTEHVTVSVDAVVDRGIMAEWTRHRVGCLDGDTELSFDLPKGQSNGSRRVYKVKLRDIYRRWMEGQVVRKRAKAYMLVDPEKSYSTMELAARSGLRRTSLNGQIRDGYLRGQVMKVEVDGRRTRRMMVCGADWNEYVSQESCRSLCQRDRIKKMRLRSCDEITGEIITTHISDIWMSGVKPVYEVSLDNGYQIVMTMDHRVLTNSGWLTLREAMEHKAMLAVNGVLSSVPFVQLNRAGNRRGMALTPDGRRRLSEANRGENSTQWKGGAKTFRQDIGKWTASVARSIHEKYGFRCAICEAEPTSNNRLECHHVDPVWHNPGLGKEISNLITTCRRCNIRLYNSNLELVFLAEVEAGMTALGFWDRHPLPYEENDERPKARPTKLSRTWASIVGLRFLGERETYDIAVDGPFHNFVANGVIVHNSYTVESTRFVNYAKKGDITVIAPAGLNAEQYELWMHATETAAHTYHQLIQEGAAPQIARSVVPMALATRMEVTYNLRAWRHFFLMRTTKEAHPQMREIAIPLLRQFQDAIPLLYDDITPCAKQAENLAKAR